jgi:hypothetical protein
MQHPDLCQHIVEAATTAQPMILIHTAAATAYTCPACAADYAAALLTDMSPRSVLNSLHFDRCDHGQGTCWACLEAFKGELASRWARLKLAADTAPANKIGRLRTAMGRRYDRAKVTAGERRFKARAAKPAPYPLIRRNSRRGDAARAGAAAAERNRQAREIGALRPPSQSITVVHAA